MSDHLLSGTLSLANAVHKHTKSPKTFKKSTHRYEDLKTGMHGNTAVYGDETGWYVNGDRYWVWVFVGKDQAVFVIDKSRKRKVALSILEEFDGIVVSDSFGAWNCIGGMQQKCLLHYFRDMYRTKEKNTSPEFSRFFSTLYHILKDAIGRKKGHNNRNSKKECIRRMEKLKARVRRLMGKKYDCKDCKRYVKRLKREIDSLFTFILYDVQYRNNISERMLRAFAEARKVLYGSRTKKGADRTAIMMSVYATCNMRGINFYDFAQECLAGKTTVIPEKSAVQTAVLCISCLIVLHCRIKFWELHALWQQKSCSITVSALMQGMIL